MDMHGQEKIIKDMRIRTPDGETKSVDYFSQYIERFVIPLVGDYSISITSAHIKENYTVWSGGCAISVPFPNIQDARYRVFQHANEEVKRRIAQTREELESLENIDKRLDNDMFNLALFKVDKEYPY